LLLGLLPYWTVAEEEQHAGCTLPGVHVVGMIRVTEADQLFAVTVTINASVIQCPGYVSKEMLYCCQMITR
jgi:hypothetical protein